MRAQLLRYTGPSSSRTFTITRLHAMLAFHSLFFLFLITNRPNDIRIPDNTAPNLTRTTLSVFETARVAALAYCLHLWCATLGFAWWCAAQCAGDDGGSYSDRDDNNNEKEGRGRGGKGKQGSVGWVAELAGNWEPVIFRILCAGLLGTLGLHALPTGWNVSPAR
ncbi:hypothetical protein VTH82DRAFT_3233 [Thermothelomyces myriococcoides]